MRFFKSVYFRLLVGAFVVFAGYLLSLSAGNSGWPEMMIVMFGCVLMLDGIIWWRHVDNDPLAEQLLVYSVGWATRRYVVILVLAGVTAAILCVHKLNDRSVAAAIIAQPILYAGLLLFDFFRAMKNVDDRIR